MNISNFDDLLRAAHQIEADFKARVESEFDRMIESAVETRAWASIIYGIK